MSSSHWKLLLESLNYITNYLSLFSSRLYCEPGNDPFFNQFYAFPKISFGVSNRFYSLNSDTYQTVFTTTLQHSSMKALYISQNNFFPQKTVMIHLWTFCACHLVHLDIAFHSLPRHFLDLLLNSAFLKKINIVPMKDVTKRGRK